MTKVGTDILSQVALDNFKKEGFDKKYILVDETCFTGITIINIDKNTSENFITVAPGACDHISDNDIELFRNEIESGDIFLRATGSKYGNQFIPKSVIGYEQYYDKQYGGYRLFSEINYGSVEVEVGRFYYENKTAGRLDMPSGFR